MAKTKAKAKTVKVRVVVFYDDEGHYTAAGEWAHHNKKKPSDDTLLAESDALGCEDLPHTCLLDLELPIPKPLKGTVLKVKAVKR